MHDSLSCNEEEDTDVTDGNVHYNKFDWKFYTVYNVDSNYNKFPVVLKI